MINFRPTDIALITTEAVEKTFENQDAYLYAQIELVKDDNHANLRTYKIRTDLATYQDYKEFQFDEATGEAILDAQGNQTFITKQKLSWLETRQNWYRLDVSYDEIDAFAASIATIIPQGLTKTQREQFELNTIFLLQRQQQQPWGIDPNKWKIVVTSDLIREVL